MLRTVRVLIAAMSIAIAIAIAVAVACPASAAEPNEMRAHELSLAVTENGEHAAWHGGYGEGSTIYVQKLDHEGRLTGPAFPVSDGKQLAYEPDLIATGDQLVVAWYEKDESTGMLSARLAGVSKTGERLWIASLKAQAGSSRNPTVRQVGTELQVAWIEQPLAGGRANRATIWHQRFSLAGNLLSPARRIGRANRDTWNLNASAFGQDFIVTYDAALGSKAHELHMLVVRSGRAGHRQLSADDGHASLYPDLQVNRNGQAALTWFDEKDGNKEVYLLAAPIAALAKGVRPTSLRITNDEGESIGAYLAWNESLIGLAWRDGTDDQSQIFGQLFSQGGQPLGPIHQLAATQDKAGIPVIRPRGNGFMVAWNDYLTEGIGAHLNVMSSVVRTAPLTPAEP